MSENDVFYPWRWRCVFCLRRYNGTGMRWGVNAYGYGACRRGDGWRGTSRQCIHPPKETDHD